AAVVIASGAAAALLLALRFDRFELDAACCRTAPEAVPEPTPAPREIADRVQPRIVEKDGNFVAVDLPAVNEGGDFIAYLTQDGSDGARSVALEITRLNSQERYAVLELRPPT